MNPSKTLPWFGIFIFLFIFTAWLPSAPASTNINVKAIGEPELKSILDSNRGQVLLVNVWATWCKPCREEFPDLVRLQDFYKGKKVQIITISADYPDEIDSKIVPFLLISCKSLQKKQAFEMTPSKARHLADRE